jgi:S-methyl-5-thioribulose 1-phosphate isomerase
LGNESEARAKAEDICLEQTVELPEALVTQSDIREHVFGHIENLRPLASDRFEATITFAVETVGAELTQLVNVLFGNISMKPGIRLERFDLPASLATQFHGPRFGRVGLRERLGVSERPLLCTALKPMGLGGQQLADLAYQLALGGIDIIKDDHGLAGQPFAPYEERVLRCAEAVARANQETGWQCIYAPNVTAPALLVRSRALFARQNGGGGLLISPGLTGLDAMRELADDGGIGLPILSHPALQGSFVQSPQGGISHFCLFGQLNRLAGADAVIFPNYGGRFSYTREDCRMLAAGTDCDMGPIKPIFPTPAGGMSLSRVPEMRALYGRDVIILIGGGLRSHSPDLIANCRYFRELVERF